MKYKIEESEVLELLSDSLRVELIIHLNGKMLHKTVIFEKFNIKILSEITFVLKRETFTIEEVIFHVN